MAKAIRFHRLRGSAIVLRGIARVAQIVKRDGAGVFACGCAIVLLGIALLLVTYREPEGACAKPEPEHGSGHGHHR